MAPVGSAPLKRGGVIIAVMRRTYCPTFHGLVFRFRILIAGFALALLSIFLALPALPQTKFISVGGGSGGGSGTVTTVAVPAFMGVSGNGTATITLSFNTQAQGLIFASPCSGSGAVTWRALCAADIPTLAPSKITGTAVITTDLRLSDSRTPTAHASTHGSAGSDPIAIAQSQVSGLTSDLAAREETANKNAINGYAGLDSNGKISSSQLPSIAITDTFVVASQVAMLALPAETGDVAIRTDSHETYILAGASASTLSDWELLETPTDSVTSVAGQTGAVTLTVSDISGAEATANKNSSGGYAGLDGSGKISGAQIQYGSSSSTATEGNDSRLSDARTPTAHASTHASGGTDPVTAAAATALAADPSDCSTPNFSRGINASGTAQCAQPAFTEVSGTVGSAQIANDSIQLGTKTTGGYAASATEGGAATTADALSANGTNCSAGNYALGVDASGNAEGCTVASGIGGTTGSTDNVALRADGTGGSTAQASDIVIGDASGSNVNVSSTAGNALTLKSTAPAQTAAAQAGVGVNISGSPAVAGSSTAGAAAGATNTYTAGDAARLTSGNANGGGHNIVVGNGIGSGTKGWVNISYAGQAGNGFGTETQAALTFGPIGVQNSGFFQTTNQGLGWSRSGGANNSVYSSQHFVISGGMTYGWASGGATSSGAEQGIDTSLSRKAAGVMSVGTGGASGSTDGWVRYGGTCVVAADQTNASTTPQTAACYQVTSGSVAIALTAGRTYTGKCVLFLGDSVATDGAVIDFDGGTATATTFRAQVTAFDTALNLSTQTAALATDASASTFTGNGSFEVHFGIKVNAAGTFQPRFFQAVHTTGTLTLAAISYCTLDDATP